jgi:molybdopterin synthase catalytic subunit
MFKLYSTPLESLDLKKGFANPNAGAFACFEGWVRDHNEGKKVKALSYEAFEPLCVSEAEKILAEAKRQFGTLEAKCYHRAGDLKIGEMAVWVGVTTAHRDEAFKACRFIIDEVKVRLPIWKKEYYENGDSGWVGCERCAGHSPAEHLQKIH